MKTLTCHGIGYTVSDENHIIGAFVMDDFGNLLPIDFVALAYSLVNGAY